MMRQYLEMKAQVPGRHPLLPPGRLLRDVLRGRRDRPREALDITLTSRAKGDEHRSPCAACRTTRRAATSRGCSSTGSRWPSATRWRTRPAKGIVRREVTRVVTPGTVLDEQILDPREPSFLLARRGPGGRGGGWRCLDASTGELPLRRGRDRDGGWRTSSARGAARDPAPGGARLAADRAWVGRGCPAAVAYVEDRAFDAAPRPRAALRAARRRWTSTGSAEGLGPGLCAAGAVLHYLAETQRSGAAPRRRAWCPTRRGVLLLDETTRANLELVRTLRPAAARDAPRRCSTGPRRRWGRGCCRSGSATRSPTWRRSTRGSTRWRSCGRRPVRAGSCASALPGGRRGAAARRALALRQGNARDLRRAGPLAAGAAGAAGRPGRHGRALLQPEAGIDALRRPRGERTRARRRDDAAADPPRGRADPARLRRRSWTSSCASAPTRQGLASPGSRPASASAPASAPSRSASTRSSATTSRSPSPPASRSRPTTSASRRS